MTSSGSGVQYFIDIINDVNLWYSKVLSVRAGNSPIHVSSCYGTSVPSDWKIGGAGFKHMGVMFTVVNDSSLSWVASAVSCLRLTSDYNRPYLGSIKLNVAYMQDDSYEGNFATIAHELGHVIGISSSLFGSLDKKSRGKLYMTSYGCSTAKGLLIEM
jgi:hypothetical protein